MTIATVIRTELWLIRHGESTGNRDGLFQGQSDLPLTAQGVRQAELLAERLRGQSFAACYTSDLARARETARPIEGALGATCTPDPLLREIDGGAWSGLSVQEIQQRFPEEWLRWQARDPDMARGGGESYRSAAARISQRLGEIARAHAGGRILVVSHGLVIRLYLAEILHLDLLNTWRLEIGNASICRVRPGMLASGSRTTAPGQLLTVNDCAHLEVGQAAATL
jgi:probable phosphoglycerate mutase